MDFQQMPIGFAMALAQNSAAMEAYAALSREAQSDILTRAHGARSEAEMHRIVSGIVNGCGRGYPRPQSANGQSAD